MPGTIVAVGMFDGVHLGHQHVLQHLKAKAVQLGLSPAVVTFASHPRHILHPGRPLGLLTDPSQRTELLRQYGVADVYVLDFDMSLRQLTARQFAERVLIPLCGAKAVMLGYDNGFGSDRLRGLNEYRRALEPLGIMVYGCEAAPGMDVSSSAVRHEIAKGDISRANQMLGRPYRISGVVVRGKQLGRKIGFPTANLHIPLGLLIPAPGVYAATVVDGPREMKGLPAMLNIGTNPTVNGENSGVLTLEAHIIGNDDDFCPNLYGKRLTLGINSRLRDEKKFDSVDSLRDALLADKKAVLSTNI